jgi:hypothetical protein
MKLCFVLLQIISFLFCYVGFDFCFLFSFQAVEAKELFKANQGINFTLDHCWAILHNSPKWTRSKQSLKKTKD